MKRFLATLFILTMACCKPAWAGYTVTTDVTLTGHPHPYDIYRPDGADKIVIFLHGGAGTKGGFYTNLGVTPQLLMHYSTMAVFPQGQYLNGFTAARTWNNYAMDSGVDDVSFLLDLVDSLKVQYGITRIYLAGHSMGGVMASRMWCEAPGVFAGCISISGPPSQHFNTTPCSTGTGRFLSVLGAQDNTLNNTGIWEDATWTLDALGNAWVDSVVIGERTFLDTRVDLLCGGTVAALDADAVVNATTATWKLCEGSLKLIRIESAGHSIASMNAYLAGVGTNLLSLVLDFASGPAPGSGGGSGSGLSHRRAGRR